MNPIMHINHSKRLLFHTKNQTKDIPKTVSVKDYDGQYIGEHKKKRSISEKHKGEAIKKYKDYVKDTFGYDCKINLVEAYTNASGFSEKRKTDGFSSRRHCQL